MEVGGVKHIVLAKFKEEVSEEKINEFIKEYSNLVNLIEPMKTFQWGSELSVHKMEEGFTHVFESSFDNVEGLTQFFTDPVHHELGQAYGAIFDKVLVVDYKPLSFLPPPSPQPPLL